MAAMIAAMGEQWFNTFNEMSEAWIAYHQKYIPLKQTQNHIKTYLIFIKQFMTLRSQ